MKIYSKLQFIAFIVLLLIFLSCRKREQYSDIPFIQFESFQVLESTTSSAPQGLLKFSFTDGDGDIGLNPNDTTPPHDYNIYSDFYIKHNGAFIRIIAPDSVAARIPYITPTGANKALKGDIEVTIPLPLNDGKNDTIRFDSYIYDRAMHKSNTITTPEFILTP